MKNILKVVLAIIFIGGVCFNSYGQSNENSQDSSNDQLSQEDFKAVLEVLSIEIFKFNVNFSKDQNYRIVMYQEEYEKRNKIKEFTIWGTQSPFRSYVDGKEIKKVLEFIRIVTKKDNTDYILNIAMGDFRLPGYKIRIDSIYPKPHLCKSFKLPNEFSDGSKIPLLLIGSFWDSTSKDGKVKIERFCWDVDKLDSDFSNKAFDEMPHYFIVGIKVEKKN